MTVMNSIRAALENHLLGTSGLPSVAFPNVQFDPNIHELFIRSYFAPVSRRPANLGPSPLQRYDGLYTLNVCHRSGSGEGENLQVVDALLSRFDATVDILHGDVKIGISFSESGVGYPDSPFYCIPVVVSWFTYH